MNPALVAAGAGIGAYLLTRDKPEKDAPEKAIEIIRETMLVTRKELSDTQLSSLVMNGSNESAASFQKSMILADSFFIELMFAIQNQLEWRLEAGSGLPNFVFDPKTGQASISMKLLKDPINGYYTLSLGIVDVTLPGNKYAEITAGLYNDWDFQRDKDYWALTALGRLGSYNHDGVQKYGKIYYANTKALGYAAAKAVCPELVGTSEDWDYFGQLGLTETSTWNGFQVFGFNIGAMIGSIPPIQNSMIYFFCPAMKQLKVVQGPAMSKDRSAAYMSFLGECGLVMKYLQNGAWTSSTTNSEQIVKYLLQQKEFEYEQYRGFKFKDHVGQISLTVAAVAMTVVTVYTGGSATGVTASLWAKAAKSWMGDEATMSELVALGVGYSSDIASAFVDEGTAKNLTGLKDDILSLPAEPRTALTDLVTRTLGSNDAGLGDKLIAGINQCPKPVYKATSVYLERAKELILSKVGTGVLTR